MEDEMAAKDVSETPPVEVALTEHSNDPSDVIRHAPTSPSVKMLPSTSGSFLAASIGKLRNQSKYVFDIPP